MRAAEKNRRNCRDVYTVLLLIACIATRRAVLVHVLMFLVCVCYIYIFIRINCSFKNKKLKKTKEKDTHNVSKSTAYQMHTNCTAGAQDNINIENRV